MSALLHRIRDLRSDQGIGIVEVVVAMMVFSVIAVGMAYSMFAMTRLTDESTKRESAANLAASEIDRVQSISDAFDVFSSTTTTTLEGVDYTVVTSVGWVSTTGASGSCGSGGGNLQYKRVNVSVTWPDMYLDTPVRADSALAPESRINDPSYGTVLVNVLGADGTGRSGVTVRVTPESGGGGEAITETIAPTDVEGCTYVLRVSPGKYKIEVEKSGYVDSNQIAVPSYTEQEVAAGATTSASFQYDNGGSFTLDYAATSTQSAALPSNLETTYVGGLSNYVSTSTASPRKLHPFPSGYQAIAGNPADCLNVDPENWDANATLQDGVRAGAVAAGPGASSTLPIPMGVIQVTIPDNDNRRYITAVQESAASDGDPGCATTKAHTFSTRYSKNATVYLALPYGTWKIYAGNSFGAQSQQLTSGVAVVDGVISFDGSGNLVEGVLGNGAFTGGVARLDPRRPL